MRPSATPFVIASWLCLVGTGFGLLLHHGNTAGAQGAVLERLPAALAARLGWTGERPLVVVCAHPQCPCLPSTVGELARILASTPAIDLRVVAFVPSVLGAGWDPEALPRLAVSLPAATIIEDRDGALARALGAATSGHVLLYRQGGGIGFSGGITAGRGHAGDNGAARKLARCLAAPSPRQTTAVFGCPLAADTGPSDHHDCCKPD